MSTIVTRLFRNRDHAASAVAELKHYPLGQGTVHVIPADGASDDGAADRLAAHLVGLEVGPAAAAAYAKEAVRTAGTLVVVDAGFGRAARVVSALERCGAVELEIPDRYIGEYSPASPLSDAFGLPVLSRNPTPLSSLFGLPVLTRGNSSAKLMDNPAPLSRAFGLPVLKSGQSNTKLSSEAAPLSRAIGLPTSSSNPAPLSSMLGLPTLTKSDDDRHR